MMPSSQKDLNSSPLPSFHFSPLSLCVSPTGCGMSAKHNPPMTEIVVKRPPVPTRVTTGCSVSPRVSARPHPPAMTQGPPPSAFRLQPRHTVKSASSFLEARIRKRRAHSMSESVASSVASSDSTAKQVPQDAAVQGTASTPLRESIMSTKMGLVGAAIVVCTTTTDVDTPMNSSSQYGEDESPAQVDTTVITLQGLSLKSPQTDRYDHTDASPPFITRINGSSVLSSFSKFHSSPTSIRFEGSPKPAESPTRRPRTHSNASSKSSPKFAPLIVISHRKNNMATPASQRTSASQRPPLHGGASTLLFSLDARTTSRDSDEDEDFSTPKRPPPAVFCPNSTCSTNSSISTIHDPMMFTGPSSKQARTAEFESPGKRNLMHLSPRTPLPKITLTPRSSGSNKCGLPRFPSPTDDVYNALTPMTLFSERFWVEDFVNSRERSVPSSFTVSIDAAAVPRHHPSLTTRSFIPMPDWNDVGPSECDDEGNSVSRAHHFLGMKTRSILGPSTSHDTSQLMLVDDEHGSLSDSDDDHESFLLAAPSIIVEENLQASHRHFRQRRCLVPKSTSAVMPQVNSADHPSSSSLLGMDFVKSCSELYGMDKSNGSRGNLLLSNSSSSLLRKSHGNPKRDESPSSEVGLEIDGLKRGTNDSSGRDLITPPINMVQALSPPPLPPTGALQNCKEHRVDARSNPSNGGYL